MEAEYCGAKAEKVQTVMLGVRPTQTLSHVA